MEEGYNIVTGVGTRVNNLNMIHYLAMSLVIDLLKAGGGALCPPPSTIFLIVRERIWMAPRRSLTFF